MFYTLGGDYDKTGKIVVNSPEAIKTLSLMVDLTKEGAAKAVTTGFINSQLNDTFAFAFDTSAGYPFYKSGAKFNFGITTLPGAKRGLAGPGIFQGTNLIILKDVPKPSQELAAKFMQFVLSPRINAILATSLSVAPASELVENEPAFKANLVNNPDYGVLLKQARAATFEPRIADWSAIRFNVIEEAVKLAVAGKATPKDALDKAQKQVEDLLSGKTK
jgi:ABC-type glycerol-3-phosphate transport system substrate-binding protein